MNVPIPGTKLIPKQNNYNQNRGIVQSLLGRILFVSNGFVTCRLYPSGLKNRPIDFCIGEHQLGENFHLLQEDQEKLNPYSDYNRKRHEWEKVFFNIHSKLKYSDVRIPSGF
ncbi:MAG: hypothetical protein SH856_02270 [Flavobacteriales bacterium]|nr:hypothetical protein [Flavobacteriales bacterium]